ncbi:DUF4334 domain-containing protein [Arthrobacter sp. zg-Y1219]|uniref:DUF4334 domain-containing protein n=1 Tax=Arthrobacter sp. zg-Y1219 TaxID=3049067 RepID=UPI0024C39C8F|nr:DUF4334 domain-containing protein [Arthrobacter sp. zg-Y1219]MDK1361887.1 DUF4334 domain-containing protein [Arthrobacter sp. zg-Y1219]
MSQPNQDQRTAAERLQLLRGGTTAAEALAFFDSLPPLHLDEAAGSWRGSEVPTGHPLNGVLGSLGWHGKRFDGVEAAHPLVFETRSGRLFEVNPGLVPLKLALHLAPLLRRRAVGRLIRPVLQLARTTRPRARLRMMEYRGVGSATMIYDALPINDAFRRVDSTTLLGAMDLRGPGSPFIFSLQRIP